MTNTPPDPPQEAQSASFENASLGNTSPPPPLPAASPPFGGGAVGSPPQPPRKSHRGLVILLVILAVLTVFVGGLAFLAQSVMSQLNIEGLQMPMPRGDNTIAILRINGAIGSGKKTLDIIERYEKAEGIKAILVRVDSPGGAVGGSEEIYRGIQRLRDKGMKIVVSMGNTAASGGYYVACPSDRIFSNAGTLTGSVGVLMSIPNFEKVSEKIGVSTVALTSGKFKNVPSTMRQMSEEEKQYLQVVIEDTYAGFTEVVLRHRRAALERAMEEIRKITDPQELRLLGPDVVPSEDETTADYLKRIADGRVMTGRQARKLGLVDEIGSQADALERLAEIAGIKEPKIYEYIPQVTLSDLFSTGVESTLKGAGLPLAGARLEYRMPY